MKFFSNSARILVTASLFLAAACDDAEDPKITVVPEVEAPRPDAIALQTLFEDAITSRTQHFTIDAAAGGTVTGSKGTHLSFYKKAFLKANGDPVTGNVDVEFIEVYSRAQMVMTRKAANGKNSDGKISTLLSGGEFYVNATQNGVVLKSAGFQIIAPTKNTGEADKEMRLFNGVEECVGDVCDVVWEEVKDRGMEVGLWQNTGGVETAYFVYQNNFGWTNIDKWYNDPRQKTTIFIDVPEGYDNKNCAVFIAYEGEPRALGRFDRYDDEKGMFTEHYGLIPIGLKVHIILVSVIEDEMHYAIQTTTIKENHVEVIDEVKKITEDELTALIEKLP